MTKEEKRAYFAKYYQDHKEEKRIYGAKFCQDNKEKIAKYMSGYAASHKEKIKEYQAKYREEHKDALLEYRQARKEITRIQDAIRHKKNRETRIAQMKEYRRNNPDEFAIRDANNRARKRGAGGTPYRETDRRTDP